MNGRATREFWARFDRLPPRVQRAARDAYAQWRADPGHPSLWFKRIRGLKYWSARVTRDYRAVGEWREGEFYWLWIGTHAEYDQLLRQR